MAARRFTAVNGPVPPRRSAWPFLNPRGRIATANLGIKSVTMPTHDERHTKHHSPLAGSRPQRQSGAPDTRYGAGLPKGIAGQAGRVCRAVWPLEFFKDSLGGRWPDPEGT